MHATYARDNSIFTYIFEFQFNNKNYSIDAREDNGCLGRLINHSGRSPNLEPQLVEVDGTLCIMFFTGKAIRLGMSYYMIMVTEVSHLLKEILGLPNEFSLLCGQCNVFLHGRALIANKNSKLPFRKGGESCLY